jgi:hypothetical protein
MVTIWQPFQIMVKKIRPAAKSYPLTFCCRSQKGIKKPSVYQKGTATEGFITFYYSVPAD